MSRQEALSAYRIMWIVVFFDLPTTSPRERKFASEFRKNLKKNGFSMFQYSVYMRPCPSTEAITAHKSRVKRLVPPYGHVSVLGITDKQYGCIENFRTRKPRPLPPSPRQLEMF